MDPVCGDPQIDVDMRKFLAKAVELDDSTFKNLSEDILGPLSAQFMRLAGLAQQHYTIKTKQSIGALKGELRKKGVI